MPCAALYVHIPFCRSKCSYCDFYSLPAAGAVPDSFIAALTAEISFRAAKFGISAWSSVYVGGGTPSLLSVSQLERLLLAVHQCRPLVAGAEVTVEINPESMSEAWLCAAAEAGVNRVSAGIQALDDNSLRSVRRAGTRKDALRFLELANSFCKSRVRFSADLIAGIPAQTKEVFLRGLRELLSFNPDHVSLYTLTLEEHTPLYEEVTAERIEFSGDFADDLWLSGRSVLEAAGYRQYEVSNFAKSGFESAHNMAYWQCLPYVGVGPAACGTIGAYRYTNTRDTALWTKLALAGELWQAEEGENLSPETQIFEFLFMGFRTLRGISAAEFERRFGENLSPHIEPAFSRWKNRNLAHSYMRPDGFFYALTAEGLLFLNRFCAELG